VRRTEEKLEEGHADGRLECGSTHARGFSGQFVASLWRVPTHLTLTSPALLPSSLQAPGTPIDLQYSLDPISLTLSEFTTCISSSLSSPEAHHLPPPPLLSGILPYMYTRATLPVNSVAVLPRFPFSAFVFSLTIYGISARIRMLYCGNQCICVIY
jgi:hypothetical protein